MSPERPFPDHSPSRRHGKIISLPRQDYQAALELQRGLCLARLEERHPDALILLEHSPVFTLGRRSRPEHWGGDADSLKGMGYDVYEVERGGSVTYHGPGQIVVYPILRLREFCPGPKGYVRMLEEVVIRVLKHWGIPATRVEKLPGVFVYHDAFPLTPPLSPSEGEGFTEENSSMTPTPRKGGTLSEGHSFIASPPSGGRGESERGDLPDNLRKIAALGVRITRGITMHGFALNVNLDLKPFELITPCGIEGCRVTSMEMVLGELVDMVEVRDQIIHHFGEVFALEWHC